MQNIVKLANGRPASERRGADVSIKMKLSSFLLFFTVLIMGLYAYFGYLTSRDVLRSDMEAQMEITAKEIATVIQNAQQASSSLEIILDENLKTAALSAAKSLPSDPAKMSDEELSRLAWEGGLSRLSVAVETADGLRIVRSSDTTLLNKKLKGVFSWLDSRVYESRPEDVPAGTFWSGPVVFAENASPLSGKWGVFRTPAGYYLCPALSEAALIPFQKIARPTDIIDQTLGSNPILLEIGGFNPLEVGTTVEGAKTARLFGTMNYLDDTDSASIRRAYSSGEVLTDESLVSDKRVIKSFIPVDTGQPTVITVVSDFRPIREALDKQLRNQIGIGMGMLVFVLGLSYLLVHLLVRPLERILRQVNEIADGNLGARIPVRRRDELGVLGKQINMMSLNLEQNRNRLQSMVNEILETKEQLESFINHTSDAICVMDLEGRVQRVNRAFESMFGWTIEELEGRKIPTVPPHLRQESLSWLELAARGGWLTAQETVRQTKEGRHLDVSVTLSPLRDNTGRVIGLAAITRDITERKKTEEVLLRSEKLAVVGQLAAGVAHEIRNPLTTLRGFVQLLKAKQAGNPEHLDLMLSELDRINFIVSEFMILAKPQVNQFHIKDPGGILKETALLMQPQAALHDVRILTEMEAGVPEILCEENQLKQVFVNLLKNGIEAMPEGGDILVRLSSIDEKRVMFRFLDQGCGIPEDQLARLGEPFYTNKESGNGLGLMVCQQIVANHQGSMLIRSELGKGTCIDVILPVEQERPETGTVPRPVGEKA